MKLIDVYNKMQEDNLNFVVIIRIGIFYTILGKNACKVEKYFSVKRTCFSKGVCKIGVPIASLNKLVGCLEYFRLAYVVYGYTEDDFEMEFIYKDKMYKKMHQEFGESLEDINISCDCRNCYYLMEYLETKRQSSQLEYRRYITLKNMFFGKGDSNV